MIPVLNPDFTIDAVARRRKPQRNASWSDFEPNKYVEDQNCETSVAARFLKPQQVSNVKPGLKVTVGFSDGEKTNI